MRGSLTALQALLLALAPFPLVQQMASHHHRSSQRQRGDGGRVFRSDGHPGEGTLPCMSPQAPTEEKGPPGAESIPVACLQEEVFPGTSSPVPFAIQHPANTVATPGWIRSGSVPSLDHQGEVPPEQPSPSRAAHLNAFPVPGGPSATRCPVRANLRQNKSKKRSLKEGERREGGFRNLDTSRGCFHGNFAFLQ